MLVILPRGGKLGMLAVRLFQVLPSSLVMWSRPSLLPAQIWPFSRGDSAMANTVQLIGGSALSLTNGPKFLSSISGALVVRSGLMTFQLCPPLVVTWTILASHIDFVVVVGRDGDGHGPLKTVFEVLRGMADVVLSPDADASDLPVFQIVAGKDSLVLARPDDVVVNGIGNREAGFAAADIMPHRGGDDPDCLLLLGPR